jgi:uroporphyrinogen decarboxylase
MTSRERYRKAINHHEPDRVPIDAGQDLHNGLHEVAYRNLLRKLGETDQIVLYDQMQHLAVVKESVLERLHVDTRYIFAGAPTGFHLTFDSDRSWLDEWGIRRRPCGLYDESIGHPLQDCTLQSVKEYRMPNPRDPARFEGLREKSLRLQRETDYALIGGSAGTLFYLASEMVGFEEYMEKVVTEPMVIEALVERLLEYWIDFFDGYLAAIGDIIEVVWMGDDWGTQLGPVMNPAVFRSTYAGRYKQLIASIKNKSKVKVALHSCGSVHWAMADLVAAGVDILHPLQGDAAEMDDPGRLKKEFGRDLVFYSNIRNQSTLPHGTPQEVVAEVRKKIAHLAPGGGYVMSGGHNIQADVPPENILALYDATVQHGGYPIG